jgi:hypothetical protein
MRGKVIGTALAGFLCGALGGCAVDTTGLQQRVATGEDGGAVASTGRGHPEPQPDAAKNGTTPAPPPAPPAPMPGRLALGAGCHADTDCGSGHCAEEVCCNDGCAGGCASCRLPGSAGTCRPLASGTICGAGSCRDGYEQEPSACDGAGRCVHGKRVRCPEDRCADERVCASRCDDGHHDKHKDDHSDGCED